ncbi:MAG TPA: hypothetical protein DCP06_00475 [Lachnospiraceae bacterium]|nr:hypothetical protein [Lachnospiraceae bacterium]
MKSNKTVRIGIFIVFSALATVTGSLLAPSGALADGETGTVSSVATAKTTVSDLIQSDAGYDSGSNGYYVTLKWISDAESFAVYQINSDGEIHGRLGGDTGSVAPPKDEDGCRTLMIGSLSAGGTYEFCVVPVDAAGTPLIDPELGQRVREVRTLPKKQATPKLSHWYSTDASADFYWTADSFVDGYTVRVEGKKGKKLATKNVSGSAVSATSVETVNIKPRYKGRVARVRVRGYVLVNGKKKYSKDWSSPCYYASSKKIKLDGYKDTVKISEVKVKGADKKVVYVSKKKKKGFVKAATMGAKETSCSFSEYGDKLVLSDKIYYVRVYYYYKVSGKMKKSPIYDEGMVYVKPTYFYNV